MTTPTSNAAVTTLAETGAEKVEKDRIAEPKKKERNEKIRLPEQNIGGRVNRFLLCSIVSQSARRLKSTQSSESASVTMVGRRVLKSYMKAAMEIGGPLADSVPDIARLGALNKKIVEDEVLGQAQNRVDEIRGRHGESRRSGDEARIKSDQNSLANAIAHRDWLEKKMNRD